MNLKAGSDNRPPDWCSGNIFQKSPSKVPARMARIKMLQSSINAKSYTGTSSDTTLSRNQTRSEELSDRLSTGEDLRELLGPLGSLRGSRSAFQDAVIADDGPVILDDRYYRRNSDRIAANYTPTAKALNLDMISALIRREAMYPKNSRSRESKRTTSLGLKGQSREMLKVGLASQSQDRDTNRNSRGKEISTVTSPPINCENELKLYNDTMRAYRNQLNNYVIRARKSKLTNCIPQSILNKVKIPIAYQFDRNRDVLESVNDLMINQLFQDVFADYFEAAAHSMLNYDIMDVSKGLQMNISAFYLKAKQKWWYDERYSSHDWKILRKTGICHEEVQIARENMVQKLHSIHPVLLALQEQWLTEELPREWSLKLHIDKASQDVRLSNGVLDSRVSGKRLTASSVLFVNFLDEEFLTANPKTFQQFVEIFAERIDVARDFVSNFWLKQTAERLNQCIHQFVIVPPQSKAPQASNDRQYRNPGACKSKIFSPISCITPDSKSLYSELLDSIAILMSRNIRENVQASIQAFLYYFEQFLDPEYQGEAALLLSVELDAKLVGRGKEFYNADQLSCFVIEPSLQMLHDQIRNCICMIVRLAHDLPRIDDRVLPSAGIPRNVFLGPCTMQVDDDIVENATMRISDILTQQMHQFDRVLTNLHDSNMLFDGSYEAKAAQLLDELDEVKASTTKSLNMAACELKQLAKLSTDFDSKTHDKYTFGIFAISCVGVKQKILSAARDYTKRILAKLAADNSAEMNRLSQEFDEIAQKLVLEPVDFDELNALIGYYDQSQNAIQCLVARFYDDICRRIYFLECHDYVLSREDIHSFLNLHRWPEGIRAFQRKSMEMQARRKHELEIIMEERNAQLSSHCLTLQHRIEKMREYNNLNDASTYLKRISAMEKLVNEVELEADTIRQQGSFLTDDTNYNPQSLIVGLKQILAPIAKLWSTVSEALAFIQSSREARLRTAHADDNQQHCMEYKNQLVTIMDELQKYEVHATGVSVAHDLMGMLDEAMESVSGRVPN